MSASSSGYVSQATSVQSVGDKGAPAASIPRSTSFMDPLGIREFVDGEEEEEEASREEEEQDTAGEQEEEEEAVVEENKELSQALHGACPEDEPERLGDDCASSSLLAASEASGGSTSSLPGMNNQIK